MRLSRQQAIQVSVLLFGCLLSELNYTLLAPALPVIMDDMSVSETDVQWLMSVYALVEAVVIPLNAFFLGRFSTRKLFAGSFALFAAGVFPAVRRAETSLAGAARHIFVKISGFRWIKVIFR